MSLGPERFFRLARPRAVWQNAIYTFLQVVGMWSFFLGLLPYSVRWLQLQIGIPLFLPGIGAPISIAVFWLAGCIGLYSGFLFVRYGNGTPLPLDQTTHLVVLGPYRYIRNPMALLGILQGIMVGLWMGSWPVMLYAVCGAIVWHVMARPYEEIDLEQRHGEEYVNYKQAIRNWIPRRRPYPRVVKPAVDSPPLTEGPGVDDADR